MFTRADAGAAGATRGLIEWRLSTARWEALYPGVYRLAGVPQSWRQRLLAACLASGDEAFASRRAAARLYELPGGVEGIIEIGIPAARRVRRAGIRINRARGIIASDIGIVDAIPTTRPSRTLIDLAGVVSAAILEEALDDAIRRRLTSLSRLQARLGDLGGSGRQGTGLLRQLIDIRLGLGATPESVPETRLLRLLRTRGLPEPIPQYEIREAGRLIARPDFAYPDVRLAIEFDSYRWHSGRPQWEHDLARRNELMTVGWRVVHITWKDLKYRPDSVVGTISSALRMRVG